MTGHINRLSSSRNISIWLKWEGKKKIRALWEYRNLMAFISQRAWPSPCLALDMHYTCSLTWPHTPAPTLYAAPLSPATCVLADTRTTSSTRDQTWNYILFPWLGNATVQKRIRTISKKEEKKKCFWVVVHFCNWQNSDNNTSNGNLHLFLFTYVRKCMCEVF